MSGKIRTIGVWFIVLLVLLWSGQAMAAVISINPDAEEIRQDTPFQLEVYAYNLQGHDLDAYDFSIRFNSEYLQFQSYELMSEPFNNLVDENQGLDQTQTEGTLNLRATTGGLKNDRNELTLANVSFQGLKPTDSVSFITFDDRNRDGTLDSGDVQLLEEQADGTMVNLFESDFAAQIENFAFEVTPVPLPGAFWLLGCSVAGLAGLRRWRVFTAA